MATGGDSRRLHFQCPAEMAERLDAVSEAFDRNRSDLLVAAVREYLHRVTESETFRVLVGERYFDGRMEFDEVKRLVGAETARRFRLLGADLKGDSLDPPPTAAGDGRDGEERSVDPEDGEDRDR